MKTLQELFIESEGDPVLIGEYEVVQTARIPLRSSIVQVRLLSPPDEDQGVALAVKKGFIELSDGSKTKVLYIWHGPDLPSKVKHRVECREEPLLVYNIYRIRHSSGLVTEDHHTGNAGMVLLEEAPQHRRYACSAWNWKKPFNPDAIEFEIEWQESK